MLLVIRKDWHTKLVSKGRMRIIRIPIRASLNCERGTWITFIHAGVFRPVSIIECCHVLITHCHIYVSTHASLVAFIVLWSTLDSGVVVFHRPGFWEEAISCLSDSLHFTSCPTGLLAGVSLPLIGMPAVKECHLSARRIWCRIRDPNSNRRTLSVSSRRVIPIFQWWVKFIPFQVSMWPKPNFVRESAANACASGNSCQIGGFIRTNEQTRWFSERFFFDDFRALDIPVSMEMQKNINLQFWKLLRWNLQLAACFCVFHPSATTHQLKQVSIEYSPHHTHCRYSWNDYHSLPLSMAWIWIFHTLQVMKTT